jgi:LPS-assembly lipoprotein
MSLLNRRTLLMLPLALAACGFTPVYGPGGSGTALYGNVLVQAPEETDTDSETNSYVLVRELEQRLGRGNGGDYTLELKLRTRDEGQAITRSDEITRYSVIGEAGYRLLRADGSLAASGEVNNFTGYSAVGSNVETLAGERDAKQRLMVILADQITTELLLADLDPA